MRSMCSPTVMTNVSRIPFAVKLQVGMQKAHFLRTEVNIS
jgi:hypothetical protein